MKYDGRLLECDNCGEHVFLKLEGQSVLDGGFTRVNKFEDAPKGWMYQNVLGKYVDLCPTCAQLYAEGVRRILNKASIWQETADGRTDT